jgi:hypothetical protein
MSGMLPVPKRLLLFVWRLQEIRLFGWTLGARARRSPAVLNFAAGRAAAQRAPSHPKGSDPE